MNFEKRVSNLDRSSIILIKMYIKNHLALKIGLMEYNKLNVFLCKRAISKVFQLIKHKLWFENNKIV